MNEKAKLLLERLEQYGFECVAGPLTNCVEFIELKEILTQEGGKSDE